MILFQKLSHSRFPRSQIESILGSTFQAIGIDNNKWSGQNLGTIFKCYSLSFLLKIQLYCLFLM